MSSSASPLGDKGLPAETVHRATVPLDRFECHAGGVIDNLRMGYRTVGSPRRDDAGAITNASLLLHATGFDSSQFLDPRLAGPLFGLGGPLDHRTHYTVIPDGIGRGLSSKPSTDGAGAFPAYGYQDQVEAQYRLLGRLGIPRVDSVIGTSMGGMQAWLWAQQHPRFMTTTVAVAASPGPVTGRNLVWRRLIAEAIRNDPEFDRGFYNRPLTHWTYAMSIARIMASNARAMQSEAGTRAETLSVMRQDLDRGESEDANDTLREIESSSDYDPSRAIDQIVCRFLSIGFEDDLVNPVELRVAQDAVQKIPAAAFALIPAGAETAGHLSLLRADLWVPAVQAFLNEADRGAA